MSRIVLLLSYLILVQAAGLLPFHGLLLSTPSYHEFVSGTTRSAVAATPTSISSQIGSGLELWVDRESLGGLCSDQRSRQEVSPQTPWCTLGKAGLQAIAGDTVYVRQGDYTEVQPCDTCTKTAVLQVLNSGTKTAWLRFVATSGERVRLLGSGGVNSGLRITDNTDDRLQPRFVSIEGFTIQGFTGNCVFVKKASDVKLARLNVTQCGKGAIELHETARTSVVASRIHHNPLSGWTSAIDLYKCRDGNVLNGNLIWDNTDVDGRESEGHGLTMDYCLASRDNLIENNIIWNNEGWCMAIYFSDNAVIRHNTCWHNGNQRADAGEISIVGRHHHIYNNILLPRKHRLALNLRERKPDHVNHLKTIHSDSNLLWAPTHRRVVGWSFNKRDTVERFRRRNPAGWGKTTLQQDPMLIDPSRHDFRLRAGSPAIDTGDESQAAFVDANGKTRPVDGNGDGKAVVDRGAYEYHRSKNGTD